MEEVENDNTILYIVIASVIVTLILLATCVYFYRKRKKFHLEKLLRGKKKLLHPAEQLGVLGKM